MAPTDDGSEDRSQNSSSASPPNRHAKSDHPEDNPFIAFRRYADEHLSSLLQSLIGLPSAIFPPSTKDWLAFSDDELNRYMKNWRRLAEEELDQSNRSRSNNDIWDGQWYQGHRFPGHSFPSTVFDAIFDSPYPFLFEFPNLRNPFFFDLMSPGISAGWPISYLLLSPYSPLHLERQQRLYESGDQNSKPWSSSLSHVPESQRNGVPNWRDAFEDLLRLENGEEMLQRKAVGHPKSESSKDWLAGMVERGSLGPHWNYVRKDGGRGDYFKYSYEDRGFLKREGDLLSPQDGSNKMTQDDEFTELDLYDAFLRDINSDDERISTSPLLGTIFAARQEQKRALEELIRKRWKESQGDQNDMKELENTDTELDHYECHPATPTPSKAEQGASTTVSTTTTTERRTLPDGSIRTKTVVNKRFADGREETVETEEITAGDQFYQSDRGGNGTNEAIVRRETNQDNNSEKDKRSGWFWNG